MRYGIRGNYLLSVKITRQTSRKSLVARLQEPTRLPAEGMRVQIELRGEVCELELSGASRRVLMSNRGIGAGAIKSGLIDSGAAAGQLSQE